MERRGAPQAFFSPLAARFSPQTAQLDHCPLRECQACCPRVMERRLGAPFRSLVAPRAARSLFPATAGSGAIPSFARVSKPVPFSSGSSLPTSSPPYFAKGSNEALSQVSAGIGDPLESPYVLFSAHKGAELAAQGRSAAVLAACRTLAEELTEKCFPAPGILASKEGSSQARYFVSRLIPAHRDPPYEQARFPQGLPFRIDSCRLGLGTSRPSLYDLVM